MENDESKKPAVLEDYLNAPKPEKSKKVSFTTQSQGKGRASSPSNEGGEINDHRSSGSQLKRESKNSEKQ